MIAVGNSSSNELHLENVSVAMTTRLGKCYLNNEIDLPPNDIPISFTLLGTRGFMRALISRKYPAFPVNIDNTVHDWGNYVLCGYKVRLRIPRANMA